MRHLKAVFLIYFVMFPCFLLAQIPANNISPVLTNDILDINKSKDIAQIQTLSDQKSARTLITDSLIGITSLPVVVHIIHDNGPENISNQQVAAAIAQLNNGFRHSDNEIDMQIAFCLAKQDPNGNPSSGINRIQSTLTSETMETDDHALKQLSIWDPTRYINVWIVRSINSSVSGPAISGYATMPVTHGSIDDGIVVEASCFGTSAELSQVVIHNFGHYLGLYHTFEGGRKNGNCLLSGDMVTDTHPDASTQSTSCTTTIDSCNTHDDLSVKNPFRPVANGGPCDQPYFTDNFMDFNYLYGPKSFTQGQKDRARLELQNVRSSLLTSNGCNSTCPTQINASYSISSTEITTGSAVNFTNTTLPESGLSYEWYLNDMLFSTNKNPTYNFAQSGDFTIKLIAKKDNCADEYLNDVKVICPLSANFTTTGTFVRPGTKISFQNTSTGFFSSATWLINDTAVSHLTNLDYTFTQEGFFTISLLITTNSCQSRKEIRVEVNNRSQISKRANYWYFGIGGGISFSSGIATSLSNSPSTTNEACNSISDEIGNFLFSTLPIPGGVPNYQVSVKDRNHNTMPNGAGLVGGISTSQMLIVPHPGNANLYYIFGAYERAAGGLYYSIVDMSKNGGLGDVIVKNVKLQDFSTEKMAATLHANGRDYWIVTHPWNSDEFHTYLINQSGLVTEPTISKSGTKLSGSEAGACGAMKISPNGKFLAMAAQYDPGSFVEVFDFNNNTGRLSYFVKINNLPQAYGLEFSPDASKLYVSAGWYTQPDRGLFQYNLTLNNSKDIINSKYLVYLIDYYGQMQLGPDGRIYYSKVSDRFMGIIQNPDKAGAECDYNPWGLMLEAHKQCYFGLPNFVSNFVVPNRVRISSPKKTTSNAANIPYVNAGPDITICRDEQTILKGEGTGSCTWFDASGNQIVTSWELPVRPLTSTFYVLKVQGDGCSSTDTVMVTVTPVCEECAVDAGQDQAICNGQTTVLQAVTNGHCTRNNCSSRIPPLTCANGCNSTLTGSMSANVNPGQTACVPAGASFSGSVAINGGTLIVCGYANPSNIVFNSGRIIVTGAADFSSLPISGTLENYGNIYIKNDCAVNSTGELQNYGYLIVDGSFSSNRRTSNYSTFIVSHCFSQNGADVFTNECTFSIGSDLHGYGTLINNGSINVNGIVYLNSGSQLIAADGSILSVKDIYFNSHVEGGSAGYASVNVEQSTFINGGAILAGLLDICDKNGIELNSGSLANTVTTDCRSVPDNQGGAVTFVWTDANDKTVGFGKQISVKPLVTTVYTVTTTDVNGNRASDQVTVIVNNCD